MKTSDLRVGMSVAIKASTYAPDVTPPRAVVVSLDYRPPSRLAGPVRPEDRRTLTVRDEHTGEMITVTLNAAKRYPGQSPMVALAYPEGGRGNDTFVPPGRIEGPWAEVAEQRRAMREAKAKTREAKAQRERETDARAQAAIQRLRDEGNLIVTPSVRVSTGQIVFSIADVEAIADALETAWSQVDGG